MAPTRLALIGAGGRGTAIGRVVARDLAGEAAVTVVCDLDQASARRAAAALGDTVAIETDFARAMARQDVDAVIIAVPPGLHRDVTVAASATKKHVLCEKPIAVALDHADAMVAACRAAGVVLCVGYFFRFAENRSTLRDLIRAGTIGRPVWWRESLPPYGETQRWLGDESLGGGALFEYSHSLDFACHVFGRPLSVFAQVARFNPDPAWRAHDSYAVTVRFASGDTYHLSGFGGLPMSGGEPPEPFPGAARYRENDVVGPVGQIFTGSIDGRREMVVTEHPATARQRVTRHPWDGWGGFTADPTPAMLRHFLECVRTGRPSPLISGEEARQTLAIVQGALESSQRDQVVRL